MQLETVSSTHLDTIFGCSRLMTGFSEIAQAQLAEILIGLQQNMIAELQNLLLGQSRSEDIDYSSLLNFSESSKLESISALAQQFQRFQAAAPIARGIVGTQTSALVEDTVPLRNSRPYSYTADDLLDAVTVTADRSSPTPADNRSHTPDRAPSPELRQTPPSPPPPPPPPSDTASASSGVKKSGRTNRGKQTTTSWNSARKDTERSSYEQRAHHHSG